VVERLDALRDEIIASDLTLIDIPIGLKSSGSEERHCDREARKLLGKRASSVFPAPCRQALECRDYAEASSVNQSATGRKLSRQSWAIVLKIYEVDSVVRGLPERRKLREMHPELCFMALNGGEPMGHNKKKAAGQTERLAVLSRYRPDAETIFQEARTGWLKKDLANDDILDALVGAVVASHPDWLVSLPTVPEEDDVGLPMEMVYAVSGD
jgi:predicted RNase H-like nuclease